MSSGYIYRVESRRIVYQHREVLFDKIGEGPHFCHYCSRPINWAVGNNRSKRTNHSWGHTLVVEHLDGNRANNDPSNLVEACQPCNLKHNARLRSPRG